MRILSARQVAFQSEACGARRNAGGACTSERCLPCELNQRLLIRRAVRRDVIAFASPRRGENDETDGPVVFDMRSIQDEDESDDDDGQLLYFDGGEVASGDLPSAERKAASAARPSTRGRASAGRQGARAGRGRGRREARAEQGEREWFEAAELELSELGVEDDLPSAQFKPARGKAVGVEEQQGTAAPGAPPAGSQQQQQQRPRESSKNDAATDERDVFYQGVLTKADNDADPADHVSGFIAIIGRPNAGKSTLLNALVGQKLSIVSSRVQTTRHRVLGILSGPSHQAVLVDTPGVILEERNKLEGRMMGAVKRAMREADAIVAIIDADHSPEDVLQMIQPPEGGGTPPMCVVLNKRDLLTEERMAEVADFYRRNCRCDVVVPACAKTGAGIPEIRDWMVAKLPLGPTLYPKQLVSEHPERFFVSEIIREHVFHQYEQEIPYAVQVNVQEFKERGPGQKDYVSCELVCERDSQKGILIGEGGLALKALATAARAEIEQFLGRPIYLELHVRAEKGWREDSALLKKFGY